MSANQKSFEQFKHYDIKIVQIEGDNQKMQELVKEELSQFKMNLEDFKFK
jgi:hypothetical protein